MEAEEAEITTPEEEEVTEEDTRVVTTAEAKAAAAVEVTPTEVTKGAAELLTRQRFR